MRLVVVRTLTGERLTSPVEVKDPSTNTTLGATGKARFKVPVSVVPSNEFAAYWGGPSVTFVFTDDSGAVEYAGYGEDLDWDGEDLTISAVEVGVLLGLRTLNMPGEKLVTRRYQGASLRDVLIQVLRTAFAADAPDLPMVWPKVDTAAKVVRVCEWWRFETAQQVLDTLQAEVGAPVIDFRPEWGADNRLRWRVRVGQLGESTWPLAVSTPGSPVRTGVTMRVKRDFKAARNAMFVTGNGQEAKITHGAARFTGTSPEWLADAPALVAVSSWGTVESKARANDIARGLLAARLDSVEKWQITVTLDGRWARTDFVPGDRVEVQHPGDGFVAQGVYQRIVLGVARDSSETVRLTVQEVATQVDRLSSGLGSVLRRLAAAESQASNRASTTIDEIMSAVDRAEKATSVAQKAADDAKARAEAARKGAEKAQREAERAKRDAAKAQSSASAAGSAAASARSRADSAFKSAGVANSAAKAAANSALLARRAADSAQFTANAANVKAVAVGSKADRTWREVVRINNDLRKRFGGGPGGGTYPILMP